MAEQEKSPEDIISDSQNEMLDDTENGTDVDVASLALGDETETQPAEPIDELVLASDDMLDDETSTEVEEVLLATEDIAQTTDLISENSSLQDLGETIPDETTANTILSLSDELETQPADPLIPNDTVPESIEITANAENPVAEKTIPPTVVPAYSNSSTDGANVMESTNKTSNNNEYEIMPEIAWPPPMFVKRNISPQERYYLEKRWHSQWRFFDKKANDSKKLYFRLQRIVVIGSVTVPVLVSLDPDIVAGLINSFFTAVSIPTMSAEFARLLIDASTVVLSLAVAIAAGLESLNKYGDNWSSYRQAAEELQAEKSFYDVNGGRYANNPDAFSRFVERTEEIIAQQNGRFVASVEKQVQESEKRSEDYLSDQEDLEQGTTISEAQMAQETSYG